MEQLQIVHLDTNILIWLYEGSVGRLGKAARRAIDKRSPVASAAAVYELEVLYELGRRASPAKKLMIRWRSDRPRNLRPAIPHNC